jgi:hypothetical protein
MPIPPKQPFEQWKKEVYRLAKRQRRTYLLPSNNALYLFWEKGREPHQVTLMDAKPL